MLFKTKGKEALEKVEKLTEKVIKLKSRLGFDLATDVNQPLRKRDWYSFMGYIDKLEKKMKSLESFLKIEYDYCDSKYVIKGKKKSHE